MKILLTGHLGYIGAVLGPLLVHSGYAVTGLDTGYFDKASFDYIFPQFKEIKRDIRDIKYDDLVGYDAVIHLAGISNDPAGALNPSATYHINKNATIYLAMLAREAGVKRFLFSSSCSVYGASNGKELLTEESPVNPVTAYAESKIMAEQGISECADTGFSPVFLRNATVFGYSPYLRTDLVINNLVGWAHTTNKVKLMSDGTATRPFIHVEDLCEVFCRCLTVPRAQIHNQIINVGSQANVSSILDVARIVKEAYPGSTGEFSQGASADVRNYNVSFEKLTKLFPDLDFQWDIPKGVAQMKYVYSMHNLTLHEFLSSRYIRVELLKDLIRYGFLNNDLTWRQQNG